MKSRSILMCILLFLITCFMVVGLVSLAPASDEEPLGNVNLFKYWVDYILGRIADIWSNETSTLIASQAPPVYSGGGGLALDGSQFAIVEDHYQLVGFEYVYNQTLSPYFYNMTPSAYFYNQTPSAFFYNMTPSAYFYNMTLIDGSDNASWNQSFADTLYANVQWNYNQTASAYFYNMSDGVGTGNESWNQSFADTLYSALQWGYNQTQSAYWYNMTQSIYFYNMTVIGAGDGSYNATYEEYAYNQTASAYFYNMTPSAYFYNQTASAYFYNMSDGNSGAANIFDQVVNTTSNITFYNLTITDMLSIGNDINITDDLYLVDDLIISGGITITGNLMADTGTFGISSGAASDLFLNFGSSLRFRDIDDSYSSRATLSSGTGTFWTNGSVQSNSSDGSNNFFEGNVSIGTASSNSLLTVVGNTNVSHYNITSVDCIIWKSGGKQCSD